MVDGQQKKLPARLVAQRYNVSTRSLNRWGEEPDLEFPSPTYVRGRRYWDLSSLIEWDEKCASRSRSRSLVGRKGEASIAAA